MTVVEAEVKALIKFYERRGWSWAYVAEFTLARASGTLFPDLRRDYIVIPKPHMRRESK